MATFTRQRRTFRSTQPGYVRKTSNGDSTIQAQSGPRLVGPTVQDVIANTQRLNPARTPGTGPISYNTLAATPSPLSLQNPTPLTGPQGLEGYISASLASYNTQQQGEIETLKQNRAQGQTAIASIFDRLTNQGQRSEEIYADEGVDDARKQADDYTSQIEAEQLALRRSVDTMRAKGAQSRGSFNDEVANMERASLSKQADLGILQAAATRRYETAAAIADRKIQMEFEPLKVQLEALKFFYSENQAQLSKKEDQQFQQLIAQDERDYNEKFQEAKTLQDTKLQFLQSAASQGAPPEIQQAIQASTTPEGVIQAAGVYAGDILDRQVKESQLATERLRRQQIVQEIEAGEPLTGEYGALVTAVGGLVPGAKSKSVKNGLAQALGSGDYVSAYAQIGNAVEEGLTGTNKTLFADARNDYNVLGGLRTAIQEYTDAGGDMGLLQGKEEQIKRNLGIDSGKASALAVQLWREFQMYRSNMTGAAFSAEESRDYASVNPTLGKSLNLNLSVIDGAQAQLENRITSTINARVPGAQTIFEKVGGTEEVAPEDSDEFTKWLQSNGLLQ